jgi:tRNA/tmRNA/rRNA uracil-C5-methylase (TrmA/RlmC/RlmD family)
MTSERNYVKFDFDNIKLEETWLPSICDMKDVLVNYIKKNNYYVYNKMYKEDVLNFYSVTSKVTSLNEIYILLLFVYPYDDFEEKYNDVLKDISNELNTNTKYSQISLYYEVTKGNSKPIGNDNIKHISGPRDICENVNGYRIYISPNSFTQSNYNAMIQLYKIIDEYTKEHKTDILHYYGRGMTPICHFLNNNFSKIYGYTTCNISYKDGMKTLENSGVKNIELIYDKNKEEFIKNVDSDENKTVIISASRNGFHKLDKVKKFTKCLYIACNMNSFLKEIKDLPLNYQVIGEVDMFPGTEYKEIVIEIT